MNLDVLPAGAAVLIDANILIYAAQGSSPQCRSLLARCVSHEVTGILTVVTIAEFCHRRMMQEAQSLGLATSSPAKALAQNPLLINKLSRYMQEVEDLLAADLTALPLAVGDFAKALELQRQHGLLTNDSLHLAAGWRAGIVTLATNDSHFDRVPGIKLFKPSDVS